MGISISTLALEQAAFIRKQLEHIEQSLHPSVTEDEELVRRALFAVRNKSVNFERFVPLTRTLNASVQDVRITHVSVNFRTNEIICDCPQEEWCRHKVSVLLSLYQYIDSVQDWAAKWRTKKSINLHMLASNRTPESWMAMVDEVMTHLLPEERQVEKYLISTIAENAHTKLRKHLPFEREWQPIYNLFMEIAILNKIWAYLNEHDSNFTNDYFEYFFDRRFETIQNTIHELSGKNRLFATDPFFDALQVLVRDLLLNRQHSIGRRLNIYLLFWDTVFVEKRRAEEELEILKRYLEEGELNEEVPLSAVFNVFYILLKEYDSLKQSIENISSNQMNVYFGLAKFAHSRNDDMATEMILKAMLPLLNEYINGYLMPSQRQMYVRRIHLLYDNIPLTEKEELMLYSAFGVYGVQPYSHYLLKEKRYEEWVALHQLYPSSISYLETCGLKEVLEEAPEVTLPLYHYYAVEEVNQKSRMNYKQAVRIWKMMKSASKKCGKTNFWADYIHTVREQYKRLRALQEELEKGNLLV